jgi:hypothetical protein
MQGRGPEAVEVGGTSEGFLHYRANHYRANAESYVHPEAGEEHEGTMMSKNSTAASTP